MDMRYNRMYELRKSGWSLAAIAREFKISRQRIYQIIGSVAPENRLCRYCGLVFKPTYARMDYCCLDHERKTTRAENSLDRFLSKINFTPDENGCHNWIAGKTAAGYGHLCFFGKERYAHHVAYEFFLSPILNSLFVLHSCDNRACCNPVHLWLGTQWDNIQDRDRKGRGIGIVRGAKHYAAKLKEEDVIEIRKLVKGGASQSEVARQKKVSVQTINSIIKRRNWKWLEEEAEEG